MPPRPPPASAPGLKGIGVTLSSDIFNELTGGCGGEGLWWAQEEMSDTLKHVYF